MVLVPRSEPVWEPVWLVVVPVLEPRSEPVWLVVVSAQASAELVLVVVSVAAQASFSGSRCYRCLSNRSCELHRCICLCSPSRSTLSTMIRLALVLALV